MSFKHSNLFYLSALISFLLAGLCCRFLGVPSGPVVISLVLIAFVLITFYFRKIPGRETLIWTAVSLLFFSLYSFNYRDFMAETAGWQSEKIDTWQLKIVRDRGFVRDRYLVLTRLLSTNRVNLKGDYYLELSSYAGLKDLNAGDVLLFSGRGELLNEMEAGSYRQYLASKEIAARARLTNVSQITLLEKGRPSEKLHERLSTALEDKLSKYIAYPASSLAFALLSGSKDDIPSEIKDDFRMTGTYHMLAVSGMHAGIIFLVFFSVFRFFGLRKINSAALVLLAVFPFYLYLTDFQVSIVRTFIMMLAAYLLSRIGRQVEPLRVLFFTMLLVLAFDPNALFSISFQLSFSAVFGIFLAMLIMKRYSIKKRIPQYVMVSLGAQLFTAPFLVYYFGYLNWFTMFYNVMISFIMFVSLVLTVVLALMPWGAANELIGTAVTYLNNSVFHILNLTRIDLDIYRFDPGHLFVSIVMFCLITGGAVWLIKRKPVRSDATEK